MAGVEHGREDDLRHQVLGLSGRALTAALLGKYVMLLAYGVWATLVEVPTFTIIGGSAFSFAWSMAIVVFAAASAVGVVITWVSGRFRFEKWSTIALICTFVGYSFALVFRAVVTESWHSAPLALVPVVVCVLPAMRWFSLVIRGRDLRFTERRAAS